MIRFFFLPFAFLLSALPSTGQWESTGGPFGTMCYGSVVTDSAIYITALHGVYRSVDNGDSWTQIRDFPVSPEYLKNYSFSGHNSPIAASGSHVAVWNHGGGGLLYSHDYGDTWEVKQLSGVPISGWRLYFLDTTFIIAGAAGVAYSQDSGDTWEYHSMNIPPLSQQISYTVDQDQLYYWTKDTIYRCVSFPSVWETRATHPDFTFGATDIRIKDGFIFARARENSTNAFRFLVANGFEGEWFVGSMPSVHLTRFDAAVVGDSIYLMGANALLAAPIAQPNFSNSPVRPHPLYFHLFSSSGALHVHNGRLFIFAKAEYGAFSPGAASSSFSWKSDDYGQNWSPAHQGIEEPILNGFLVDGDRVWAATSSGLYYQMHGGDVWLTHDHAPTPTFSIIRVEDKLWRTNTHGSGSGCGVATRSSSDNGQTWQVEQSCVPIGKLLYFPGMPFFMNDYFIGGPSLRRMASGFWDTFNGGYPMTLAIRVSEAFYDQQIFTFSINTGYVSDSDIHSSSDGGSTWSQFPPTSSPFGRRHLAVVGEDLYYASVALHSSFVSSSGYEGVFRGWLERFEPSTQSWTAVSEFQHSFPEAQQNNFYLITGLVGHGGRLYLSVWGRGIYVLSNNGQDWEVFSEDKIAQTTTHLSIGGRWLYAASQVAGVWRVPLGPVSQDEVPRQAAALRVSPNPSQGIVQISMEQAVQHNTEVEVYSVLGKQVHRAVLAPSQTTLDLSHLPSGTYLLRAINQEFHVPPTWLQILR